MTQSKTKSNPVLERFLEGYGHSAGPSTINVPVIFNRNPKLKKETLSQAKRRFERERILEEDYFKDERRVGGQVLPVKYDD